MTSKTKKKKGNESANKVIHAMILQAQMAQMEKQKKNQNQKLLSKMKIHRLKKILTSLLLRVPHRLLMKLSIFSLVRVQQQIGTLYLI